MSAADRCALSYATLLELTSTEQHRWHDWFVERPEAWVVPFATGRMATVGGLVAHIFVVELRYAQRLLDQEVTPLEEFWQVSREEVFELGDHARSQLVQFLTSAPESELDRVLTFQTLTAGTVTAAAIVMVAVFGVFAGLREIDVKQMGVGLAVAILIDATIIRAVLLPATMKLLGEWNWYLPRRLERLPQLTSEEEPPPGAAVTA